MSLHRLLLAIPLALSAPALGAQNPSAALLAEARAQLSANRLDSAATLLDAALATAPYPADSFTVLIWRGVLEYVRGHDDLTRERFRQALDLHTAQDVSGLDQISPELQDIFNQVTRARVVYLAGVLQHPPQRLDGPAFAYPSHLRHLSGRALVRAIVDTLGRVEPGSVQVLEAPDGAFFASLTDWTGAQTFSPGQREGRPVRSLVSLALNLAPPAPAHPTTLVRRARAHLAAGRTDSALALLTEARDSFNRPSEGERVFAWLVEGLVRQRMGQDSLASHAFEAGLAGYHDLTSRGVDLAPFLRRLADSVRLSRRGRAPVARTPPLAAPTALTTVDEQPALVSHERLRYPPEMQALRIGGTVIVEATLDTTGRVLPATVRVVQSPNPLFDGEARRVVLAAVYRPARTGGRPVRAVIHQPITFAPY